MWALFQAFQAEARGKLFPSLQHVGLRHNRAAPETLRRMIKLPAVDRVLLMTLRRGDGV